MAPGESIPFTAKYLGSKFPLLTLNIILGCLCWFVLPHSYIWKREVLTGSTDLKSLRYSKICILADADSDGLHIATLLCALFVRHFSSLVDAGHIYVAMPPLYRIDVGKQVFYALDDAEKEGILDRISAEKLKGKVKNLKRKIRVLRKQLSEDDNTIASREHNEPRPRVINEANHAEASPKAHIVFPSIRPATSSSNAKSPSLPSPFVIRSRIRYNQPVPSLQGVH